MTPMWVDIIIMVLQDNTFTYMLLRLLAGIYNALSNFGRHRFMSIKHGEMATGNRALYQLTVVVVFRSLQQGEIGQCGCTPSTKRSALSPVECQAH
jgi:hypothetical protein